MKKKLTPKQKVLKEYPEAVAWSWADCWEIYSKRHNDGVGNKTLGRGTSAAGAWYDAALTLIVKNAKRKR